MVRSSWWSRFCCFRTHRVDAIDTLEAKVEALITARGEARGARDWPAADRIRDELSALKVEVMDGPTGATWRIKEQA